MTYRIKSDIHTHTLFSRHAYSTIAENVAAARAAGLEVLGSADHLSCMLFPEQHLRNFQFFINQAVWPREWDGVTLLRAAEVDIVSLEGGLFGQDIACPANITGRAFKLEKSLFDRVTANLDYLVASVHNAQFTEDASGAQTTGMYIRVLEQPKVLVLGHTGRSGVPFDIDEVLTVAKERHKLIEINEHSLEGDHRGTTTDACRRIAERCAELGVGITVSSDAHIACDIGRYPNVTAMLEEIHFPTELIMNRNRNALLDALYAAGVADLRSLKQGERSEESEPCVALASDADATGSLAAAAQRANAARGEASAGAN